MKFKFSVLTLILATILGCACHVSAQTFGIYRELWTGLSAGNTDLGLLTNTTLNPKWPNSPNTSFNRVFASFETEVNSTRIGYGERLRTYIVPPLSGYYTFWIASDDASNLFLSSDETPDNKVLIARVDGATNSREWTREPNQQSAPIYLEKGRRYYTEAIHRQGGGGDNLAVRWLMPNGAIEEPLTVQSAGGTWLIPVRGTNGLPGIYRQPTNMTILETLTATFALVVTNPAPMNYQWQLNGSDLADANARKPFYSVSNASVALNDGQRYRCVVSNEVGVATSFEATLSVIRDTNAPTLVSVASMNVTNILVSFSKTVDAVSATNPSNYTLDGGVTVFAVASLDAQDVALITSPLTFGNQYTLTVNNVQDLAAIPNTILADTQWTLTALQFLTTDVGGSTPPGSFTSLPNGVDVTGGGGDIGGKSDQFQFAYQPRFDNFDVKIRVQALSLTDTWAKAGLMARTTLASNSSFAAVFATPNVVGCYFESRSLLLTATRSGSFPVNYPYTWLRLQRSNTVFSGFASLDGDSWVQLGSVSLQANVVYLGMAVASHNTNQTATAQFRDILPVSGGSVRPFSLPNEPLGPSTRKTGLVISEIMYKPAPRADTRNLEYIEIYNSNPFFEDISGYRIAGDIGFTFPADTVLQGNSFLVIARVPADVQAVYGITNVTGPYTGTLKKTGLVQLLNDTDAVYLQVPYLNTPPWPVAAEGTGHSIVLGHPSYGEGNGPAWAVSDRVGGSPGGFESYRGGPLRNVVINELLAHSDAPALDYVELYNHSNLPVDVSGCILTDDPNTDKFVIPAGNSIPARGFLVFDQNQMGFALTAAGGMVFFKHPDLTQVLDAIQFEAQANGVSYGRVPDGAAELSPLTTPTPGGPNSDLALRDVVINELMYDPISGDNNDQYVELYNQGANAVDLSDWKFTAGITFSFPSNTLIAADNYLVVAKSKTNLLAHYANLNSANTLGNFGGKLSHGGARVALARPDLVIKTNILGQFVTNTIYAVEDEVTYGTGGRWGQWASGGGSSLELIDPRSNHRLAYNWADSDDISKTVWTNIENTGVLTPPGTGAAADALEIMMLGAGECLVDNVEVSRVISGTNGPNLIANSTFESGLSGWVLQGDEVQSSLETTAGYNSSQSLHVRATNQGDKGNRVRAALTNLVNVGQTVTIRAKVRWLHGTRGIVFTLRGGYLDASGLPPAPPNCGTPGLRNSRAVANAGPAIYGVSHSPPVPAANEPVVVTLRAHDRDGISALTVNWRHDPDTNYTAVPMVDDGTGGDAVAGDGIYSATIPGQAGNVLVAFYIQATDGAAVGATTLFPNDTPARECLVRFGDAIPTSSFGTYRFWVTQQTLNTWINRPTISNEDLDSTFVYGDFRVVYNMGARYAGSPWHQGWTTPIRGNCHYSWGFPDDDQMLGTTSFNKVHSPGNGPWDDNTIQREQTAYWMARKQKLPWNYKRYVNVYMNGVRSGYENGAPSDNLMEDTQVPGGDVVAEHYPNDNNGDLYKCSPWFEYGNELVGGYSSSFVGWAALNNYTTNNPVNTGAKKLAAYRWSWGARRGLPINNDYSSLYTLIDAANFPPNSSSALTTLDSLVDTEQWMQTWAHLHALGDWDHFGSQNGQNMYAYKPTQGKWALFIWDHNIVMGDGSWSPGQNLSPPTSDPGDIGMAAMYNTPRYIRAYYRGLKVMANGPLNNANVDPMLDAKQAAFVANGLNITSPKDSGLKQWILDAHNSVVAALNSVKANAPFAINGTNNLVVTTNNNLLTLSGTAPVEVNTIKITGIDYPITWTNVTGWTVRIPVAATSNFFNIQGFDVSGNPLSNATATVTFNYTGPIPEPRNLVVINEIMYNPVVPGASYVELFNTSTNFSFDLSNWRLDPLGFTFPLGTVIANRQYLLVVKSRTVVLNTYTNTIPVAGEFAGQLDPGGETLTLVQPGPIPGPDVIVNRVRYESTTPWPATPNGFGPALQLIDASQDNSRVSNWADGSGWRFASYTGTASGAKFIMYLESAGDLFLDELSLVAGTVPAIGPNLIRNGDFEGPLTTNMGGPWIFSVTNLDRTSISPTVKHSGNGGLHLVFPTVGSSTVYMYQDGLQNVTNSTYTLSFWYVSTINATILTTRVGNFVSRTSVRPIAFTPGVGNSVAAPMTPYPALWLNEVQAENVNGITDSAGEMDPWIELYNAGTNVLSLDGLYLAINYSNLTQWAFPAGLVINPLEFKVIFADGEPGQATAGELHTSFQLTSGSGSVALARIDSGQPQILDYLNYSGLPAGHSYGSFPDGQPFSRQEFFDGTPGGTNNGGAPPVVVYINEWMASNGRTLANVDNNNQYDDWFELYNPGTNAVNLGGYFLTDTLANRFQFQIPAGYSIPAQGYLLVWADTSPNLNQTNRPDLHVNFNLAKSGEAIGLFAGDGAQIDAVSFGSQVSDLSQGRSPDGVGPIYFLATATPRGPNSLPGNVPPVLQPISDQVMDELTRLKFTALATDADIPPQTLTFSLDPGAPAGASITTDGLLKWRPSEFQGPGVYHCTVRVTDNGTPNLSAAQAFTITVNEVNSPPSFIDVRDKYVKAGTLLSFRTGVDGDWPPQNLSFTLDAGAAQGAGIGPASGVFSWTPPAAQAPGVYSVTVHASDDGIPPLSATATYRIHVLDGSATLILVDFSRVGAAIQLSWQSDIGKVYQVQFSDDPNQGAWTPLGSNLTAASSTLSITDNLSGKPPRFYRVILIQ